MSSNPVITSQPVPTAPLLDKNHVDVEVKPLYNTNLPPASSEEVNLIENPINRIENLHLQQLVPLTEEEERKLEEAKKKNKQDDCCCLYMDGVEDCFDFLVNIFCCNSCCECETCCEGCCEGCCDSTECCEGEDDCWADCCKACLDCDCDD